MRLDQLLSGIPLAQPLSPGLGAREVRAIAYDSRRIRPETLFFAFSGTRVDGRKFAPAALSQGAVAVVSELPPPPDAAAALSEAWIQVAHARRAMALAARTLHEGALARLALVGITGTNGKTTTSYLVDSILRSAGFTTAVIGTIEYHLAGQVRPAVNTTPDSPDLYELFEELAAFNAPLAATMEVSSHALALGRVWGLPFHTGVFTNLTRDHLDFHSTMEAYFDAKCELFRGQEAPPPRFAVLNRDDAWGARVPLASGTEAYWYGFSPASTVRPESIESGFQGLKFRVKHAGGAFEVRSPLVGKINIYNILAACATGLSFGLAPAVIARGVAACSAVPGRFERVEQGQPFLVAVDYAHTDDALRNTIAVARGLKPKRIITLFGCGGDRDRAKRPLMGAAAAELSNVVVLTSDNPRSEDPLAIMTDALVGVGRYDTPHHAEPDRAKAIRWALAQAEPGDVVLITGKGHETYQIFRDRTIHFDDREEARAALAELGWAVTPA
jgi:UDP-N-acetylmuramoyl-L-alanyl-D-glutamate--2,6-diaminopimelate ligase